MTEDWNIGLAALVGFAGIVVALLLRSLLRTRPSASPTQPTSKGGRV